MSRDAVDMLLVSRVILVQVEEFVARQIPNTRRGLARNTVARATTGMRAVSGAGSVANRCRLNRFAMNGVVRDRLRRYNGLP